MARTWCQGDLSLSAGEPQNHAVRLILECLFSLSGRICCAIGARHPLSRHHCRADRSDAVGPMIAPTPPLSARYRSTFHTVGPIPVVALGQVHIVLGPIWQYLASIVPDTPDTDLTIGWITSGPSQYSYPPNCR